MRWGLLTLGTFTGPAGTFRQTAGLGLGIVLRSSAGAIAALFGALFVPPLTATLLPQS